MKKEIAMNKATFEGKITSNKMDKTVTVAVEMFKRHPLYGRVVKNTKKFKARNEVLDLKIGDLVKIEESRPFSKTVTWKVIEKLENK